MRTRFGRCHSAGWILGLAVLLAGCYDPSLSIHPLFEEAQMLAVPQLTGTWKEQDASGTPMVLMLRPGESPLYDMLVIEDGKLQRGTLQVGLGRIGEQLYWNLSTKEMDDEGTLWSLHRLPLNSFARVTLADGRLEVSCLRSEWVGEALRDGWADLEHAWLDEAPILTAPSADLQRFLSDLGDDDEAYDGASVFLRQ